MSIKTPHAYCHRGLFGFALREAPPYDHQRCWPMEIALAQISALTDGTGGDYLAVTNQSVNYFCTGRYWLQQTAGVNRVALEAVMTAPAGTCLERSIIIAARLAIASRELAKALWRAPDLSPLAGKSKEEVC